MRRRAELIMAGRFSEVVATHRLPAPLYLGAQRIVVRTADEGCAMLALMRDAYLGRGVSGLTPRVTAIDLPREDRFRVWVDWHENVAPGQTSGVTSAVYFMRSSPTGFQIEMVSYTSLAMPELNPQFASIALSA